MHKEKEVHIIRGQVDLHTAFRNAVAAAGSALVLAERSVLYPYIGFNARCAVPTIAGHQNISLHCLVDGINDIAATADDYATHAAPATAEFRLKPEIAPHDAERTAWRTITVRLGRKFRMIAPFCVQLEATGLVYKRFWILKVGNARIMTDSVTGHMHPLNASAA